MRTSKSILLLTSLAILSIAFISCASETVVKEVEVIKEVPVEKEVIKEVEVKVREVPDLPIQELGVFNTEITLTVGTNNIQIVASNAVGQRIQTDLIVAYLP